MNNDPISNAIAAMRFDARAGMTLCTPGKTVPCGKVCRTPQNCKKRKGETGKDRLNRIGKENLKEFAEARRSGTEKSSKARATKTPERGGALALAGGKLGDRTKPKGKTQSEPGNDYDPSIRKFAGKPPTDATVKAMVREHSKKPLTPQEGNDLYWRSLENRYKTRDRKAILQGQRDTYAETYKFMARSSQKQAEDAKAKAAKTKSDKVREKSMRQARQYESEAEEWTRIESEWRGMSDSELTKRTNSWAKEWTNDMNKRINSGDTDSKEDAGYTIATIKTGWHKDEFTDKSFMQGTKLADDHLKDVIRSMGDNALGIKGKPKSAEELKSAYRKAAQKAHPDAGGSAEKFQEVKESYESLKRRYGFDSLLMRIDSLLEVYTQ